MERRQLKIKTSLGELYFVASLKGLQMLSWTEEKEIPYFKKGDEESFGILKTAALQLQEYIKGERKRFDLKLDLIGTDFQLRVWKELMKIPYGKTYSYKDLATKLNDPNACRAVGTANGKNPICIIIPCHRVINANGKLGGYSGGLEHKIDLLKLEQVIMN
jgi:methylated-DNA-[protein]-cysteine S-methyltransferase